MKRKFLSVFAGLLFPLCSFSSISNSFSENSIPIEWSGDCSRFLISEDNRLQLNDPDKLGKSYVAFSSTAMNNAEWSLTMELQFRPSSSNYMRFFLCSDSPVLSEALNGYFLQVGNTNRQILLYRMSNGSTKILGRSVEERLDRSSISLSVKVIRSEKGEWRVYSRLNDEISFTEEFVVQDTMFVNSYFSGIYCKYSKTNSDKFYFDDLFIDGTALSDNVAPEVDKFSITDSSIILQMSERIDCVDFSYELQNLSYYESYWNSQCNTLSILLHEKLEHGVRYGLSISNCRDMAGNAMNDTTLYFAIPDSVAPGDLLFSEVLFNPTSGGSEYAEIYNNSNKIIDLSTLRFSTRKAADSSIYSSKKLSTEPLFIFPGEYKLITDEVEGVCNYFDCPDLSSFVLLSTMPSLRNEDGCVVLFRSKDSLVIDNFYYNASMHSELLSNNAKGISLERVDWTSDLWVSSAGSAGYGTPGYANTSSAESVDVLSFESSEYCFPYYDESQHFRLRYRLDDVGYFVTIRIYSLSGYCVKNLTNHLLFPNEGEIVWDGRDDAGRVLPSAPYVLLWEAIHERGSVVRKKWVVFVSSK